MINMLKYRYWYYQSHWHYLSMERCLRLQNYFLKDEKKFIKYGLEWCRHARKFNEMQAILDDLKIKIYQKYSEMREEAE